jgi:hypothetical protein
MVVEDVRYQTPRWSWEIEAIVETPIESLPTDLAPVAAEWIAAVRGKL